MARKVKKITTPLGVGIPKRTYQSLIRGLISIKRVSEGFEVKPEGDVIEAENFLRYKGKAVIAEIRNENLILFLEIIEDIQEE